MKSTVATLLLILSSLVWGGNIVMLTSLNLDEGKKERLERDFRKANVDTQANLIIHHEVGPALLFKVLSDPQTQKVFWISHSAEERPLVSGFVAEEVIKDIHGNDVKKFFTTTTRNLKFLAIVGCQSRAIIDGFIARNNYLDRPGLEFFSFRKKTELFKGLKLALAASLELRPRPIFEVPEQKISVLKLRSTPPSEGDSGWVELGDRVLGLLDQRVTSVELSETTWSAMSNPNIQVIMSRPLQQIDIPHLTIEINGHKGLWQLFKGPSGEAIGRRGKNLYLYRPDERLH